MVQATAVDLDRVRISRLDDDGMAASELEFSSLNPVRVAYRRLLEFSAKGVVVYLRTPVYVYSFDRMPYYFTLMLPGCIEKRDTKGGQGEDERHETHGEEYTKEIERE